MNDSDRELIIRELEEVAQHTRIVRMQCERIGLITPVGPFLGSIPDLQASLDEYVSLHSQPVVDRAEVNALLKRVGEFALPAQKEWWAAESSNPVAMAYGDLERAVLNLAAQVGAALSADGSGDGQL